MESKIEDYWWGGEELFAPATSTTQNFTKKIQFFFCINVNKNAKEKLSIGFWVSTSLYGL